METLGIGGYRVCDGCDGCDGGSVATGGGRFSSETGSTGNRYTPLGVHAL